MQYFTACLNSQSDLLKIFELSNLTFTTRASHIFSLKRSSNSLQIEQINPKRIRMELQTLTVQNPEPLPSTSTTESKLGFCEVCSVAQAKYTCPRCEVKTCCMCCSTIHKKELECDGSRDRTKYIPINKFTNIDLSSDYKLMEEITRCIESYKKGRKSFNKDPQQLPHHLFKLKKSSMARKTTLKFLPQTFDRHRRNTTKVNFHKDVIFWHIDWIFTNADNLRLSDEQVRETEKISSVLSKFFTQQEDKVLQEKLQFYQAADLSGVRIFLRAEQKPGRKFYELDPLMSLKDNFRGKIIIEYPTIHVVLKDHACGMEIIDSDDEDSMENEKAGASIIDNIIKNAESDESIYKSMKNLLFVSDGEMSE